MQLFEGRRDVGTRLADHLAQVSLESGVRGHSLSLFPLSLFLFGYYAYILLFSQPC